MTLVARPLIDTPHVNGPSYRYWSLPLPIMANLYRLSRTLLSDHTDTNASYLFGKKAFLTAKALPRRRRRPPKRSSPSRSPSTPPPPARATKLIDDALLRDACPRSKRLSRIPCTLSAFQPPQNANAPPPLLQKRPCPRPSKRRGLFFPSAILSGTVTVRFSATYERILVWWRGKAWPSHAL